MAGESFERRRQILKDIKTEPRSLEWLCQKYNKSASSIKHDIIDINIKTLMPQGFQAKAKKGLYTLIPLEGAETNVRLNEIEQTGEVNTAINVDKVVILRVMQLLAKPSTPLEVYEKYMSLRQFDYAEEKNERGILDKIENTILRSDNSLLARGLVDRVGDNRYEPSRQSPQYLSISTERAEDILYSIRVFGPSYQLPSVLEDVKKKLSIAVMGSLDDDIEIKRVVTGTKQNSNPAIKELLEKFGRIPFDKKVVEISYTSKLGKQQNYKFMTGLFFYLSEKDKLYFIGCRLDEEKDVVLDAERVEMAVTDEENDMYQNDYYMQLFKEMFAVSVEPPVRVLIRFNRKYYIEDAISRLNKQRPESKITYESEEHFVYEDTVRGLDDFAKFLRKYNGNMEVIEPEALAERMKWGCERLLQRYAEEGFDV